MSSDKKTPEKDFHFIEASEERRLPQRYELLPGDKRPYLVFGFDLGIASCGWCVLDLSNERVVALNSYIFPAPQKDGPKDYGGTKSSVADRRDHRLSRRSTHRRANRKKRAIKIMIEEGLIPAYENDERITGKWFQTKKREKAPFEVRIAALDRRISDRDFARSLYSICGHRGYIPHGEEEGAEKKDEVAVKKALKKNDELLRMRDDGGAKRYRTVGEMLSGEQLGSRNKEGDYSSCVRNSDLVYELREICRSQRKMGNTKASVKLENRLVDEVLTYVTDSSAQEAKTYGLVKRCIYFPQYRAAPRSCLSSEMYVAWGKLTNVRLVHPFGEERPLPPSVIRESMRALFSPCVIKKKNDCKVTYGVFVKSSKKMTRGNPRI